ncbi:head-tail connector protein [Blastococcus sp. CCUG 61487]|uniref:head-tail connector protein n=1 Tax=Blastococcus sp. CCUG 61487 TaxID=1840703 RepID=UPI0010BFC591|nr:head-tail connector protein [Blastococcus sp. CCUG 61487]TKJ24361.1 hypothetical protein A6V29_05020 [Blastococcus sp. CCUG 61487]
MSVVDLADFKEHLNKPASPSDEDDELQRKLDAAEAHVAKRCGPLGPSTVTVTAHLSGDHLVLPATRLATVAEVRDPAGQVVQLADGATNLLSGIIRVPYRRAGAWAIDITTTRNVATDERLADLHEAVLIIAAHLWETQRVPGRSPRPGQAPEPPTGRGFAIPNRAATLMGPYTLPGFA